MRKIILISFTILTTLSFFVIELTNLASGQALQPSFSWLPNNPSTGQPVTFTASATGGSSPYQFTWVFGDGSADIGSTVTHTYANAETYTVRVTVTDFTGAFESTQNSITVNAVTISSSFSFFPTTPIAGQTIIFTSFVSGGMPPYDYTWDFGDGAKAFNTTPNDTATHTYSQSGTYTVSLTVIDAFGNSQTAQSTVSVSIIAGVKIAGNSLFANFVSRDFKDSFYTIEKRVLNTVDLNNYKPLGRSDNWRVTISGYIYFPQDSLYNISIWCDDGCILLVARPGDTVYLYYADASTAWKDQSATRYPNVNFQIPFAKGYGKILIQHYQAGGLEKLQLRWNSTGPAGAGISDQVIPASNLFYTDETQSTI